MERRAGDEQHSKGQDWVTGGVVNLNWEVQLGGSAKCVRWRKKSVLRGGGRWKGLEVGAVP